MMKLNVIYIIFILFFNCGLDQNNNAKISIKDRIENKENIESNAIERAPHIKEIHLTQLKQLTFGGENAEAYFDSTGKKLIFQSTREENQCDQIYTMNIEGGQVKKVNNFDGRTTCAYFIPQTDKIIYSTTGLHHPHCPPVPSHEYGYVWPLYPEFDIMVAKEDGSDAKVLFRSQGYDAEATVSTDGKFIVFTSTQNSDIDLYRMKVDGTQVIQLTNEVGYDGGAFFSHDGKKIVYRRSSSFNEEGLQDYLQLLKINLVRPSKMDLWIMNADGTDKKQVTHFNGANFAPYFTPDDQAVVFSSNMDDPTGRNFEIYKINIDGSHLERITYSPDFDGFPMFSPDGKKLVFASNRFNNKKGETNIFIADWK